MSSKHPSLPYVLPFAAFLALMALRSVLPVGEITDLVLRTIVLTAVLLLFSRDKIKLKPGFPLATALVGVGVFVLWVAPDLLFPGYRQHWLFQNPLTAGSGATLSQEARIDVLALALRSMRAVVLVPIVEELFWRAWLMRWLIDTSFDSVPLGRYESSAFWITAVLFAAEHGPYWEVGLLAGIVYNAWMVKSRSLADLIWAHAITNACLSAYVILFGRWEYWR